MQRAHGLLRPGQRVADLGCWPGGWLQVASQAVGPGGRVVGVDLRALEALPLANVRALRGDFSQPDVLQELRGALGGPAHVVLSDAAPRLSGVRARDRAAEDALLQALEAALPALLAPGGALLAKLLECPEAGDFRRRIGSCFASLRPVRTRATRRGSAERYLLARGYRGAAGGAAPPAPAN